MGLQERRQRQRSVRCILDRQRTLRKLCSQGGIRPGNPKAASTFLSSKSAGTSGVQSPRGRLLCFARRRNECVLPFCRRGSSVDCQCCRISSLSFNLSAGFAPQGIVSPFCVLQFNDSSETPPFLRQSKYCLSWICRTATSIVCCVRTQPF